MPELIAGRVITLSPLVKRILAPNPGVMPGSGTNTYLVGKNRLTVIDPGPSIDEHIEAVFTAGGDRIRWILITHSHSDHYPAARELKALTGARVFAGTRRKTESSPPDFTPDEVLVHEQLCPSDQFTLRAVHTPGHASDHLCYFLEDEGIMFTGDHIMNGSTVVIAPPDGDMQAYLDSLNLLKTYPIQLLAPGHGDIMEDPVGEIDGLIHHRLGREAKVIRALRGMDKATVDMLVPPVYDDVPQFLHPVAKHSLLAHLIKLEQESKVTRSDNYWRWIEKD